MNRINLLLSILCFIILINAVPVPPPVDTYYKEHPEAFEGSSLQDIEGAPNNSGGNSSNNLGDYNSIVEEGTYQNTNDNSNSNGQIEESQNYDNYASTTSVTKSPVTQTENTTNTTTPTNQNSDNNNETKNNKNGASKGLVTFVIVVFAIIIVLSVSILVYKKKYLGNENLPTRESTFGFKTGNLMEKIQTININNAETSNGDDVIIKYDIDNEINTSELKNALEPNKNNEQYNHWFDSMKRGLKPPPSHDNKNKKKKNGGSKITGSGSLLSISTKSKSPDLSKSYKSVSKDFSISRNSTDISARTQTMISQCSSNGGGAFGYKNNKLNKHSSVALTFGCLTEREDSYNELSSTSRISNIASSRVSKISTQNSSPRSLTSFISNSPITQSFKSRFSTYFSGGKKQVNGFDNRK
ncbi:hypothetical protein BCR36DRAFT_24372 [Piromyces finnis]|uniref:Mid2 domain-containing protein n=1 Tax=Piromyces finnis TaxID=1754191 RepID=A0A1Y1VE94_9FUNG|nr:hypothetical protein BCR36DRAFT_24372 [Piromyces finnis]|eukprot:ORX53317.1 hypothetical protein BCR36DRAFT_24372 [Piromyces finnis]